MELFRLGIIGEVRLHSCCSNIHTEFIGSQSHEIDGIREVTSDYLAHSLTRIYYYIIRKVTSNSSWLMTN